VLIYDDVFTDGLTLNEVARANRRAGTTEVCGVVLPAAFRRVGTRPGYMFTPNGSKTCTGAATVDATELSVLLGPYP
jgi:hypothetical protein